MVLYSTILQALYSRCGGLISPSGSGRGNKALEQALDRRKVVELSFISIFLFLENGLRKRSGALFRLLDLSTVLNLRGGIQRLQFSRIKQSAKRKRFNKK